MSVQPPAHLEPVNIRHHDVEHDEVRPEPCRKPQAFLTVLCRRDVEPLLFEDEAEQRALCRIVVDDQGGAVKRSLRLVHGAPRANREREDDRPTMNHQARPFPHTRTSCSVGTILSRHARSHGEALGWRRQEAAFGLAALGGVSVRALLRIQMTLRPTMNRRMLIHCAMLSPAYR